MSLPFTPLPDRFWPKVDKTAGPDGCWPWQGSRTQRGYGRIGAGGHDGAVLLAHRVAWELENGAVPTGMLVCHRCDNPPCVNAGHLYIGTNGDNQRDAKAKGRTRNHGGMRGMDNPRRKLTTNDVEEMRFLWGTGQFTQQAIADMYGMSQSQTSAIVRGLSWEENR